MKGGGWGVGGGVQILFRTQHFSQIQFLSQFFVQIPVPAVEFLGKSQHMEYLGSNVLYL